MISLHRFIDFEYGANGDAVLSDWLANGADLHETDSNGDAPLHVAVRRRRLQATRLLLDNGADINQPDGSGKTSYAHAVRRGFDEVADLLKQRGADTTLNVADQFAVAVGRGDLHEARRILDRSPGVVRTGNPEEDRLLADMAGRSSSDAVAFLISAGANVQVPGLDTGTPLHVAAWFGQPENVKLLIDAGAQLEVFEPTHESSPLGWAVHGARFSGGAEERQEAYVEVTKLLLDAGALQEYPPEYQTTAVRPYRTRLLQDATPRIAALLTGKH